MSDNPPPGMPSPGAPPELDQTRLWWSLLLPPAVTLLLTIIFFLVLAGNILGKTGTLFTVLCGIGCLVTVGCWILFIQTLNERLRGPSFILLILAYPLLQIIVAVGLFFTGCVTLIFSGG